MQMLFCKVRDSVKMVCVGSRGSGFSRKSTLSSRPRDGRVIRGGVLLTTRFKSLFRGGSESSFELDGVCGGVGGKLHCSVTVICRISETEMVASAAISLARLDERGVVVKTTK